MRPVYRLVRTCPAERERDRVLTYRRRAKLCHPAIIPPPKPPPTLTYGPLLIYLCGCKHSSPIRQTPTTDSQSLSIQLTCVFIDLFRQITKLLCAMAKKLLICLTVFQIPLIFYGYLYCCSFAI